MKKIIVCIVYFYFFILMNCLRTNLRVDPENDGKPDEVPIFNVKIEEPDLDPIQVKRIEEERRIERNRLRDVEILEELDKNNFQRVIGKQNKVIEKLTKIADAHTRILNRILERPPPERFPNLSNIDKINLDLKYEPRETNTVLQTIANKYLTDTTPVWQHGPGSVENDPYTGGNVK